MRSWLVMAVSFSQFISEVQVIRILGNLTCLRAIKTSVALSKAQELRMAILKHAEKADSIAKKIGETSKDPQLSPRQAQLRMLIR